METHPPSGRAATAVAPLTPEPQRQQPTNTSPPSPPTTAPIPQTGCAAAGATGYDLLSVAVERRADSLVLTARFVPIEAGHDVWIGFTAGGSSKRVAGELFENGSGVAQVQDLATLDTVYLDGPQDITGDHMKIVVPNDSVDDAMLSGPITTELKVDGPSIEVCTAP